MGSKTLATQLKETLLQKDADIDGFLDEEETGLMYASRNCANQIVKVLLQNGAYVNSEDNSGRTALIYASRESNNYSSSYL